MQTVFEAAGGNDGLRRLAGAWHRRVIVVPANSDLADTVGVAHLPSIPVERRVIGIARIHTVCFSNTSGIAA